MGTLTLWMQTSLDGYAEGPDHAFDWPIVQPELNQYFVDELANAAGFIYGRNVYAMMAAWWPTADQHPGATEPQAAYARLWRPMPKYVLADSPQPEDWNTTTLTGDSLDRLRHLKHDTDGELVFLGGPHTAHRLLAAGLIDELRLFVHPVILGAGTPLLTTPHGARTTLHLEQSRTFPPGVVHHHYTLTPTDPA